MDVKTILLLTMAALFLLALVGMVFSLFVNAILTLITVGKFLEARSKGRTSDAVSRLMNLAPKTALLLREAGPSGPASRLFCGALAGMPSKKPGCQARNAGAQKDSCTNRKEYVK